MRPVALSPAVATDFWLRDLRPIRFCEMNSVEFGRPSGLVWDQETASSNLARPTSIRIIRGSMHVGGLAVLIPGTTTD